MTTSSNHNPTTSDKYFVRLVVALEERTTYLISRRTKSRFGNRPTDRVINGRKNRMQPETSQQPESFIIIQHAPSRVQWEENRFCKPSRGSNTSNKIQARNSCCSDFIRVVVFLFNSLAERVLQQQPFLEFQQYSEERKGGENCPLHLLLFLLLPYPFSGPRSWKVAGWLKLSIYSDRSAKFSNLFPDCTPPIKWSLPSTTIALLSIYYYQRQ